MENHNLSKKTKCGNRGWRDEAKNMLFCCYLAECQIADPRGYCWNDGDPLYRGNPITGRASAAEKRAILKMTTAEETQALLSM